MRTVTLTLLGAVLLAVAGCGSEDDYANEPRPPAPINVTAAVSDRAVSVSPAKFGAGPIVLIVTNQTDATQQVTLQTDEVGGTEPGLTQSTGPINPQDTATLKVDVRQGEYKVHTDDDTIRSAKLVVGAKRESAQNELLQP